MPWLTVEAVFFAGFQVITLNILLEMTALRRPVTNAVGVRSGVTRSLLDLALD